MLQKNTKLILSLLWLIFIVRAVFYISIIPIWEGFDEHSHFACVQYIAEHLDLPVPVRDFISKEVFNALVSAPLPWEPKGFGLGITHDEYWRLSESERLRMQRQIKQIALGSRKEPITNTHGFSHVNIYEAQHGPLYYVLSVVPYKLFYSRDIIDRVFAIRLFSVLIASLLVFLSFYMANRVFNDEVLGLGITALLIFMPGLMIDVCRVGNDSLSIVLFSALMAACLKDPELNHKQSLMIGILLGAGLLTKDYFLTAIPAIFVLLFYNSFKVRFCLRKFLTHLTLIFLAASTISLWWYLRNYGMLGSFFSLQQSVAVKDLSILELIRYIPKVDWRSALSGISLSHIWFGNWSFLTLRSWMYHLFIYIFWISLIGVLLKAVAVALKRELPCPQFKYVMMLLNFYLWFLLGLLYHVLITYITSGVSATGGWYLYSVVIPEIVLLIYGLYKFVPDAWRLKVLGSVIFLISLLDLYGLSFIMLPYYTGFISHKSSGSLLSFKPYHLSPYDFGEILTRLTANKPSLMTPNYYLILGTVFLSTSLVAITASIRFWLWTREQQKTNK